MNAGNVVASKFSMLAEELREYTAMKYMGDCKCGKCQLVPRDLIDRIYEAMSLRVPPEPKLWTYSEQEPPRSLWWGEIDHKSVVSFGRLPENGTYYRYVLDDPLQINTAPVGKRPHERRT